MTPYKKKACGSPVECGGLLKHHNDIAGGRCGGGLF